MAAAAGIVFLGFCIVMAAFVVMSVRIYQVKPEFMKKILTYLVVGTLGVVFSVVAVAVGLKIDSRHTETMTRSFKSVKEIWGGPVMQNSPLFSYEKIENEQFENKSTGQLEFRKRLVSGEMGFASQRLVLKIRKNVRKKGLLIFPGYVLDFRGTYIIKNQHGMAKKAYFLFSLPEGAGNMTGLEVAVDGKPYAGDINFADGIDWSETMGPGEERTIQISYTAQGTGVFTYALGQRAVEMRELAVAAETDYDDVKIPDGSMAPTKNVSDGSKTRMEWHGKNLVSRQNIAMDFKVEGNYGSIVSRLFFHSPVAIFLFLGFLVIFTVAREMRLHPMNYLFIMISYFIFYLLGSYVISYIHVVPALALSLAVSTGILGYYGFLAGKGRELVLALLAGAGLFQWIFSVAFFFPEHTGFLITIASILAFVALMRATAKVDWKGKW